MSHSPVLHRSRWAAVGAAVAVTLGAVGLGGLNIASADVSDGDRPVFISINPCRLVDTREASPIGAAQTITLNAHGENGECTGASAIPTDAIGISLNVTATQPTENTFLTFWGEGPNPGTSNLNPRAGGTPTPNAVSTPLSPLGTFNIYNDAGRVNVIADINGYYAHHDHDDRYVQKPSQLIIDGLMFAPEDPASSWEFVLAWEHSASLTEECVLADIDLPIGATLTDITLYYTASADVEMSTTLAGQPSGPEALDDADGQLHANEDLALAMVAPTGIGTQAITVNPDDAVITLGFSQALDLCTKDELVVGSVRIDYIHP